MRQVIDVLCRSPLADRYELELIGLHTDGSTPAKALAAARGLGRLFRSLARRPADLAWIHATKGASLRRKSIAAAVCRAFGVPYVLHLHNANIEPYLRHLSGTERRVIGSTLRHAARVVVLSASWEVWLQAFTPCRVTMVPNPVDLPELVEPRAVDPGLIVQVGRIGERKGSLLTLAAAATIRDRFPHLHVVYAGDGDPGPLVDEASRLGMDGQVEVVGWLPVDDVHQLIDSANLLALPSRAEGLPMTVLEAMSRAVPVVCTPVGGLADLVTDGVNGRIVPVGDIDALAAAFADLLGDPQEADRLGAAGRRTVEREYATAIVADRIAALFDAVLADAASGAH
jgi:glycosyltransferase involved in cell wall biosynthesis